ncbi:hypothetical protein ACFLQJ_01825, partial [Calditrichota bacterium]
MNVLKVITLLFTSTLFLSIDTELRAQEWIHTGPYDVDARCIAISPHDTTIIFIGTRDRGIWKSEDYGLSWQQSSDGFFNDSPDSLNQDFIEYESVDGIFYHPTNPDTMYAISKRVERGIARSIDGGETWSVINDGLNSNSSIGQFLITSNPHSKLFIAAFSHGQYGGLFESSDEGDTWQQVDFSDQERDPPSFSSVIEEPGNGNHIYAISIGVIIFESEDGGDSWRIIFDGSDRWYIELSNVQMDPNDPDIIWAKLYSGDMTYSLIKTIDGGNNWEETGFEIGGTEVFIDTHGNYFLPGYPLYKSTDQGENWYVIGQSLPPISRINAIAVNQFNSESIWIDNIGIRYSSNGGVNFELMCDGLDDANIKQIIVSPFGNEIVHAISSFSHWRSLDGGENWERLADKKLSLLYYDYNVESKLWRAGALLEQSNDDGDSWDTLDVEINGEMISFASLPGDTSVIIYSTFWELARLAQVYISLDCGETWEELPRDIGGFQAPSYVITSDDSPQIIFLKKSESVFSSSDLGETWSLISDSCFGDILMMDGIERCFLRTRHAVYYSIDSLQTFQEMSNSLPECTINDFVLFPPYPSTLYLATSTGIYSTMDLGEHWNYQEGPYPEAIKSITYSVDGSNQFIGTSRFGLWSKYEEVAVKQDTIINNNPIDFSVVSIYPNP